LCLRSADAYQPQGFFKPDVRLVHNLHTDTHAVVWKSDAEIVIAFRGTTDARNWLTDLDVEFEHGDGYRTHAGFTEALESIEDELHDEIFSVGFMTRKIWLTGHSLGGALAMLCAKDLASRKELPDSALQGVYTFGQPRVGDGNFAGHYNAALKDRTFRIIHADDIVPRVPWLLGSYRHAGHEVFFPDAQAAPVIDCSTWRKLIYDMPGLIREACFDRLALIGDHHIATYLNLFALPLTKKNETSGAGPLVPGERPQSETVEASGASEQSHPAHFPDA
jgi:triacylglycerol lipase